MSFPKMKLGECAEIHSGSTPRTNNPDFWDGDITWVTPKDLSKLKSKFISKTESKITQLGFDSCSTKLLPENSVLFSSRAPIGHVAINTIPMCTNQGFKSFVPKADLLDSQYLYYWLKANKEYLQDLGVGATFKEISKTVIANVEIPLPPLSEQRRIASILDKADELRQKRQQAIEKLDQLLQATFIDMFGDPVSNPKGWDKEKMDTLMTIVRGGSPRPIENFLGGTYPWIKIGDATKGDDLFITKTKEAITEEGLHKTRLLPEGSVIFANCGVSLGFARILKIQGCIHDGWLAFQDISEDKIHKLFLLKALNSITQYFRDTAPDGTQPNLNTAIMKNFELIIPSMDLQLKFIAIVESIVKQKKILETSNIEFTNLFESLQNKAFSGNS